MDELWKSITRFCKPPHTVCIPPNKTFYNTFNIQESQSCVDDILEHLRKLSGDSTCTYNYYTIKSYIRFLSNLPPGSDVKRNWLPQLLKHLGVASVRFSLLWVTLLPVPLNTGL